MAIQRNEDRNILNFARKIVAEKLIFERRQWENMRDNKQHEDVSFHGQTLLIAYRSLMIGVSSVDLLDTDAMNLNHNVINLSDEMERILNNLARYLLLEMETEDFDNLLEHIAKSIIYWTVSRGNAVYVDEENLAENPEDMHLAVDLLTSKMSVDLPYVVMILLADLHHMTFVANAEQCLEILSST